MLKNAFPAVLLVSIVLANGVYKDNTEFDEKMKEIMQIKGGNTTFLLEFIHASGFPKSLRDENYTNNPECLNIREEQVDSEDYSQCTVIDSSTSTILDITGWSGFKIFEFAVGLRELRRVTLRMRYQQELTYLYFSSFRKCDNCEFDLSLNPGLVGMRFVYMETHKNLSEVPVEFRPRIKLRGNSRLKLKNQRKRETLHRICNPKLCDIQEDSECHFRRSIRTEDDFKGCKLVYGNMTFTERFESIEPLEMNFWLDGCFHFHRTGVRFIRKILRAHTSCPKQHTFIDNKYMCTDHIEELRSHWGKDKIQEVSSLPPVNCFEGECRGGFLAEKNKDLYSGCEVVIGDLYISHKSGNISLRIRDISNVHKIHGQFQLINNPSIVTLALPFLKHINASKCPALTISNMISLENIIFHPEVMFDCVGPGPKVLIEKSPNVYLHYQMLKNMQDKEHVFKDFEYDIDHYFMETITIYLIFISAGLVLIVEMIAAARKNLILPNFLYRLFPLDAKHRPRQKPLKKKKSD